MGAVKNIDRQNYPKQGEWLNKRVEVCFNYDSSNSIFGTVVREDIEEPGRMIIKLDDYRYVLSTECQYSLVKEQ